MFPNKSYFPVYALYHIMHADDKAHGGIAFFIRSDIRHYEIGKYQREFLQTINIVIQDRNDYITISDLPTHSCYKKGILYNFH